MRVYFYRALEWIRLLFGVIPRSGFGSQKVYLVVHYMFVALVGLLLAVFSQDLMDFLFGRKEDSWGTLGVIFLVLYAIVRLVLVLVGLLGLEEESEFPDIQTDWDEILEALDRERLAIDDLPLFLVNGFTPQQEESVFQEASNIEWSVVAPPLTQKNATVRAFVSQEAIFLSCTDIGASCLQLGKVQPGSTAAPASAASPAAAAPPRVGTGTLQPGSGLSAAAVVAENTSEFEQSATESETLAAAPPTPSRGGVLGTMTPGAMQRALQTMQGLRNREVKGQGKQELAPLDEFELLMGRRRLVFLCRLLVETRQPFCPANGLLQVLPFSWAQEMGYGRKLVASVRADIEEIHRVFQMQLPVVIVASELEEIQGISDFILRAERLQPGLRNSRAGSSFPAGADVNDQHADWLVSEAMMQWFRGWVYQAFHRNIDSPKNRRLFTMLCEISQRSQTFAKLLRDCLQDKVTDNQLRLYGTYFCASGSGSQKQGFIQGVLQKLIDLQGEVAYTPQVRECQHRSSLWGGLLFAGSAAIWIGTVVLLRDVMQNWSR